jgi:hypothetical protein
MINENQKQNIHSKKERSNMELNFSNIAIAAGTLIVAYFVIRISVKSKNSGNKIDGNSGNITIGDNNNTSKK